MERQTAAHQDLARYLYVVAYNYLRMREGDLHTLAEFAPDETAALAQDFVQETLEKLALDRFALLARYSGSGRFTSWAAQVVRNQAAQELRKSYWTRRSPLPAAGDPETSGETSLSGRQPADPSDDVDPALRAQRSQVAETLQRCLAALSERYRLAVLHCLGDGGSADEVARMLGTTPNAVYLIIQRAKRQLRQCLETSSIDRTALEVFG